MKKREIKKIVKSVIAGRMKSSPLSGLYLAETNTSSELSFM
jgi:hypothetical protein